MNQFDMMTSAVSEAEIVINAADSVATRMARLIVGRLRKVGSTYVLAALKRELSDFNAHTGKWRS